MGQPCRLKLLSRGGWECRDHGTAGGPGEFAGFCPAGLAVVEQARQENDQLRLMLAHSIDLFVTPTDYRPGECPICTKINDWSIDLADGAPLALGPTEGREETVAAMEAAGKGKDREIANAREYGTWWHDEALRLAERIADLTGRLAAAEGELRDLRILHEAHCHYKAALEQARAHADEICVWAKEQRDRADEAEAKLAQARHALERFFTIQNAQDVDQWKAKTQALLAALTPPPGGHVGS